MKVAFHLRRRTVVEATSALLLESHGVEPLLDLANRLGQSASASIFRVSAGFLIKIDGDDLKVAQGSIRLRKLAENLYLPVDADLIPALLDDEARGLTRDRGLIFLPGGRVLGFDFKSPVLASSLVTADAHSAGHWQPFPDRPARADRVHEITLEPPKVSSSSSTDDYFDSPTAEGKPMEIGTESPPRPQDAGSASTIAARAAVGAGQGLIGLGALLGIKALADLGARWISRAVENVPRLTEAVLGKQESALRELLRQFREGNIDQALRRALPIGGGEGDRGGFPTTNDQLPTVDPTYSLQTLLGSNKGGGGIWFGGGDVQVELAREYRKAAEQAELQGDFRRAAYIHAKLLNDYTTAAHLLAKGGLFRDAAMLYLNRLNNLPAAARAFEAAGEVDRALDLYRQKGMHVEAGDLLRRLGEEDLAFEQYILAADQIARGGPGHPHRQRSAGDLLRDRARRPDLAMSHYAIGWDDRPSPTALACASRMGAILANRGDAASLFTLLDQADELFQSPGLGSMGADFYNEMAVLADHPELLEARDDLRDRALMGLAAQIRRSVPFIRPSQVASSYLGQSRAWPPEVINDANHALKSATESGGPRDSRPRLIPDPTSKRDFRRIVVAGGTVTAACHASMAGEVFLGFDTGQVYRVDVARGEVNRLEGNQLPVESMAVDPDARIVVMLLGEGPGPRRLVYRERIADSTDWSHQSRMLFGPGDFWLTPVMSVGSMFRAVGIWNGEELALMGGFDSLSMVRRLQLDYLKTEPHAALLVPPRQGDAFTGTILIHDGPDVCHVDSVGLLLNRRLLDWRPTLLEGQTLRAVPLAWLQVDPVRLELAGLDREGVVHWSALKVNDEVLIRTSNVIVASDPPYLATTLVRSGLVAGVKQTQVDWFRCVTNGYSPVASRALPTGSLPLACFPSHRTEELVVVQGDGTLICLPGPR